MWWGDWGRQAACTAAFGVFLDCWRRSVELQDYCVGAVVARDGREREIDAGVCGTLCVRPFV